jgi:N-acetyltransferase 10
MEADIINLSRYAIDDGAADWSAAETHVKSGTKASIVSVRTVGGAGQKRKADGMGQDEEKKKKSRRTKKTKR